MAVVAVVIAITGLVLAQATSSPTAFLRIDPSLSGDSLTLRGHTDLPDGTTIVYSVDAGSPTDQAFGGPFIDGQVTVGAGTFLRTLDISTFPSGAITIWSAFDPGPEQPPETLRRFGSDGSGLRGPGVVNDSGAPRLVYITQIERPD